jgi:hypothetical protein
VKEKPLVGKTPTVATNHAISHAECRIDPRPVLCQNPFTAVAVVRGRGTHSNSAQEMKKPQRGQTSLQRQD